MRAAIAAVHGRPGIESGGRPLKARRADRAAGRSAPAELTGWPAVLHVVRRPAPQGWEDRALTRGRGWGMPRRPGGSAPSSGRPTRQEVAAAYGKTVPD